MGIAFLTVDLGFGDSGKGATVDWLCREYGCSLVVRYCGGPQAGHTVVTDSKRHVYSQFGAGTHLGAKTFLSPAMIIHVGNMKREAERLKHTFGVNPYDLLTVHPHCLVSTPYHVMMNRIEESSRKNPHGSCGIGVGETRNYWLDFGLDAIIASDLTDITILGRKLRLVKERFVTRIQNGNIQSDNEWLRSLMAMDVRVVARGMVDDGGGIKISPVMPPHDNVVFEGAQGILLDEAYGFPPHNTWSDVTFRPIDECYDLKQYQEVKRYGITRLYHTRHGAGPLPTYSQELTKNIVDDTNIPNQWQGALRAGHFDWNLFRYSLDVVGELNGLFVNHLDDLPADRVYACEEYNIPVDLSVRGLPSRTKQQAIAVSLAEADEAALPEMLYKTTRRELLQQINDTVPIFVESLGPTYRSRRRYLGE